MRNLLITVLLILIGLSAIAFWLKPGVPTDGKTRITYLTPITVARTLQVDTFQKLNPDVLVNKQSGYKWAELTTLSKVIIQCSTGVGPDLFDAEGLQQLQSYVEAGLASDITEDAKAGGFSLENMWPGMEKVLFYNGKQYAYPATTGTNILLYNKNVFDQFGVPYPKSGMTWEECFDLAARVTDTHKDRGHVVYGLFNVNWSDFFTSMHGEYFSADGTRILLNSDTLKKAFQLHRELRFKRGITPTDLIAKNLSASGGDINNASNYNLFANGQFAMYLLGNFSTTYFREVHEVQTKLLNDWLKDPKHDPQKKPPVVRIGSVMIPHFDGLQPGYRLSTRAVVVNSKSKNRQGALKYLQYLSGPTYCGLVVRVNDMLPPNPKYATYHSEPTAEDLSEREMFQNTVDSMKYAYMPVRSPFLLMAELTRIIADKVGLLENNPNLKVEDLLNEAQRAAEEQMQTTLDRNPDLKAKYESLTGTPDVFKAHGHVK